MSKRKHPPRSRIGRVSVFEHHGSWYTFHSENGRPVRNRVGNNRALAECKASLLNAKLVAAETGVPLAELLTGEWEPTIHIYGVKRAKAIAPNKHAVCVR